MKPTETGGPAFPCETQRQTPFGKETTRHSGVTIRDYFAAKADVSAYIPAQTLAATLGRECTLLELADFIASIRFLEADAMIAARGHK